MNKNSLFVFCKNSFWVLILMFISGINLCCAQIYPFTNFSVKEGLVNSNVYFVSSDDNGFIWMGTENGLSRFDGMDFVNYTTSDLGISSDVTSVASLNEHEIVFGTESSGIYRMEVGAKNATKINVNQVSRVDDIVVMDSIIILLNEFRRIEFISISTGEIVAIDSLAHFDGCDIPISIKQLNNGDVLVGRTSGLYMLKGFSFIKINTGIYSDYPVYSINNGDSSDIVAGTDNAIYKLSSSGSIQTIYQQKEGLERIRNVVYDSNSNYWFNPWGSSQLKMIQNNRVVDVGELSGGINASVTRVFNNSDGSLWVGTLGKGVYKFDGNLLLNYPVNSGLINPNVHKLVAVHNGVLMGTSDGLAYLNFETNKIQFKKQFPDVSEYVRDIIKIGSDEYLIAVTDPQLRNYFKKFSFINEEITIRFVQSSGLLLNRNFLLAANWDNRYLKYTFPDYTFQEYVGPLIPEFNYNLRINTLHYDSFNHLWVGSKHGLRIIDEEQNIKASIYSDINKYEVFKIYNHSIDTVYAVTSNGLYVIKSSSDVHKCRLIDHLLVPSTNCMVQTDVNEFLFGTTEGLVFIRDGIKKIISVHDGLLSNIIDDLLIDEKHQIVYLASAEGLMKLDLEQLRKLMTISPSIKYIMFNQGVRRFKPGNDVTNLNYNDGSFSIKFRAFNYRNTNELNYQYRVDEGEWAEASGGEVQFASFDPGMHNIEIRSGISGLKWGRSSIIPVHIIPPFYRTWWFYTILLISLITLVTLFYLQQIKQYRRRQDEKSAIKHKLVELQQKALASTLNPHFVFNSLNSIQHFINSNNNRDANIYLAKFSRLMRLQLDMADKSFISIHEEVDRLEYYLNLEQMRFGERLVWKIEVDPDINQHIIEIPNMIIQPFVENAIWHGIMPSENKGKVEIGISGSVDECIHITIRDNGVGYESVGSLHNSDHESKGIKLIRERLALLDDSATKSLSFTNLNPGTLVEVVLSPLMYHKTSNAEPVFPA